MHFFVSFRTTTLSFTSSSTVDLPHSPNYLSKSFFDSPPAESTPAADGAESEAAASPEAAGAQTPKGGNSSVSSLE